jgi:negative regulator of flagellin synthesis FlgM
VPAKISGYSTSEPLAPLKGSNTGGVAADKTQSDAAAPSSSTSQTGDHVTLTTSARSLQKLSDAVAQAPVVNSAKVSSIKQALANGTYQIDSASVADKMIQFENGLK